MEELIRSPIVQTVIVLAVLFFVGRWVYEKLTKPKAAGVFTQVRCRKCGWRGTVGKYNKKCSQCGSTNLQENFGSR
jgi:hypothetical protein